MPRRDFERAEIELNALEHALIVRLCAELQEVSAGRNTHFFFTREHNPHEFPEHCLSKSSDELLEIARQTMELRKVLILPTDPCVGRLFEAACIESADLDNPHRLGPIRLASRLLSQIEELRRAMP